MDVQTNLGRIFDVHMRDSKLKTETGSIILFSFRGTLWVAYTKDFFDSSSCPPSKRKTDFSIRKIRKIMSH